MDPNETLAIMRRAGDKMADGECDSNQPLFTEGANEMAQAFADLDTWLSRGGAIPLAWQNFGGLKSS